jgi:hypothetical protein
LSRLAERNFESRAKNHGHYVVGKVIEVLRVRPELLFARGTTGDNHTAAALGHRRWVVSERVPRVAHQLSFRGLKNFVFFWMSMW